MRSYSVYGVPFASAIPFRFPLPPTSAPARLCLTERNGTISEEASRPLTTLPPERQGDAAVLRVLQWQGSDVLELPHGDQIEVSADEIAYRHAGPHLDRPDVVEAQLLANGFAWWLLRQGHLPLHAGALEMNGKAVLFAATSGTGKSSLLCSFLAQGYPLLCDDFTALHRNAEGTLVASSAYPQMRLWPETVRRFVGDPAPYPSVFLNGSKRAVPVGGAWGTYLEGSLPVSSIFLLNRQESKQGAVTIAPLAGHPAFMLLLTTLMLGPNFPIGELQQLWPLVDTVIEQASVYELTYPSGWGWLPQVQQAVIERA